MSLEGECDWDDMLEKLSHREASRPVVTDQSYIWTTDPLTNPQAADVGYPPVLLGGPPVCVGAGELYNEPSPTLDSEMDAWVEQATQTELWREERAVNTEQDCEAVMEVEQRAAELLQQCDTVTRQQELLELQNNSQVCSLERRVKEGESQTKAVFDKLEALRDKLALNCSKTTKKNFSVKKQELTKERDRLKEESNRLAQELEEEERRLALLINEQNQERESWESELMELRRATAELRRKVEEARQSTLRDEVSVVELQRDTAVSQLEEWLAEAETYLSYLKMELSSFHSLHHLQLRTEWEKHIALIRSSLSSVQSRYSEQLQLLRTGHRLDSLAPVTLPVLPAVPTAQMLIDTMIRPPQRTPVTMPAATNPYPSIAPPMATPFKMPKSVSTQRHRTVGTPPPAPAPSPSNPPAPQTADKLGLLLEKLRARFPQCNRTQLTAVLQQIKMSRGTMAGLSMEELTQQVALKLAQSEAPRQSLGPIGPPSSTARTAPNMAPQAQRPAHLHPGAPVSQAAFQHRPPQPVQPSSRRLCLMCQNQVEPGTQQAMSCSHLVHKECISVWVQSSQNNACPFCPSTK
ncbi:RING finger protein 214 isoform X2 [Amia ocellicauda]|uniref:RING finger protein 214 isoform X2 n=1 Tax=Amia ocellicauda TaxID=2972642 RepID=UPI0034648E4B